MLGIVSQTRYAANASRGVTMETALRAINGVNAMNGLCLVLYSGG